MEEQKEKKCEESLVEYRLSQIEQKIDQVTGLLIQQQAQEFRLNTIEKELRDLKNNKKSNVDRWLNPLIAAVVSGMVAYIFVKVGMK